MNIENVNFQNNRGQSLSGKFYRCHNNSEKALVYSHGLFSSKDAYKITKLSESIVDSGYNLLTFDFSFSGDSAEKVSELSIYQELEDLRSAMEFVRSRGIEELHLIGSSMGGVVSLLYAADPAIEIKSLITIATPIRLTDLLANLTDEDIESMSDREYTSIEGIPIRNSFFKELKRIDMTGAVKRINVPVLIFHGALDAVVGINNADIFTDNLVPMNRRVIIDDGDHNLTRESDLDVLRSNILTWLKEIWS